MFVQPSKTYLFKVVVEQDKDGWFAYAPALKHIGGATSGRTAEEAFKKINEVVQLVVESLRDHGEAIPGGRYVKVIDDARIAITV